MSKPKSAAKANRKRQRHEVDYEAFAKHWTLATSAEEVAAQMGLPKHVVHRVAQSLRAAGVPLKQMPRNRIDVKRLTEIVKETEQS